MCVKIYKRYKLYFRELLETNTTPLEDKEKIIELLKKKWNPYVHRHSTITWKYKTGQITSEAKLRQYAGWTTRSNMHYKYVHFSGNEAKNDLLRAKGLLRDEKEQVNILQPKTCPHCREPNRPDAQFCFKCNFIISFEAYNRGIEDRERKDQELATVKEQMSKMDDAIISLNSSMEFYKRQFNAYFKTFGARPLSPEERRGLGKDAGKVAYYT